MIDEENYLALSGIQHFCFCPRQWGLIHIEKQWEDNTRTFGGTLMHQKADDPFFTESRGTTVISRSMPIISHRLQLKGIADVKELIEEMYEYYNNGKTPLGTQELHCKNCSLENICIPKLGIKNKKVQEYINKSITDTRG